MMLDEVHVINEPLNPHRAKLPIDHRKVIKNRAVQLMTVPHSSALRVSLGGIGTRMESSIDEASQTASSSCFLSIGQFAAFLAEWTLYGILGYVAAMVVQYQAKHPDPTLPTKTVVYGAALGFSALRIFQGVSVFFASRNDAKGRERLIEIYGRLQGLCEAHAGETLPSITLQDFDTPRSIQLILGMVLVGVGNWLVAKNQIPPGLFVAVFGAVIASNAMIGFVRTQRVVGEEGFNIVCAVVKYVGTLQARHGGSVDVTSLLHVLEEVRQQLRLRV